MTTPITATQDRPLLAPPHLLVTQGPQQGLSINLDFKRMAVQPLVLGRSLAEADVVLQSAVNRISRKHARLSYRPDEGMVVLSDAGSANGTWLNGERIVGSTPLFPGDTLACGDVQLVFVVPNTPPPPPQRYLEDLQPGVARLEVLSSEAAGVEPGSVCRLTPAHVFLVGRAQSCDIVLVETGEARLQISRRHLEIRWAEQGYIARNPGAANPALINGLPLGDPQPLAEGDTLTVGTTVLRYRAPRMARPPLSPSQKITAPRLEATLRYTGRYPLHVGSPLLGLSSDRAIEVGRASESSLRLFDPSVSRYHARLYFEDGQFKISDKGSANGTQVNGLSITGPTALKEGDQLGLGEFEFSFEPGIGELALRLTGPVTLQLELVAQSAAQTAAWPSKETVLERSVRLDRSILFKSMLLEPLMQPQIPLPAEDYSASLDELFARLGTILTVGGNEPFLLDDPQSFWRVEAGSVEIFAVQVKSGVNHARHHVLSVPEGGAMWGLNSNQYGEGLALLAVPTANTRLNRLPSRHLSQMAQQSHLAASVADWLDQWLGSLAANLTQQTLAPRTEVLLDAAADKEVAIEPFQKIRSRKDPLWLRIAEGQPLFVGEEEVVVPSEEVYFPLYGKLWLQTLDQTRLVAASSREAIAQAGIWQGIELFYELFFRVKFTNIRLVNYDEINRLRKKAEYDRGLSQVALDSLASILETREVLPPVEKSQQKLLLAACQLVGQAQGLSVQAPIESEENQARPNPLDEIVRASRLRTRQVTLEANWWRTDGVPFLAFLLIPALEEEGEDPAKSKTRKKESQEETPVAILPAPGHHYDLVNPADRVRQPITPELAAKLAESGIVFYRPFPDKLMAVRDIVRFGFRGTRSDLLVTFLMGAAIGLLALFVPTVTSYLFDTVIPTGQRGQLSQILGALVVIGVATALFQIARGIALLRLETRIESSVQAGVWDRLLGLPTSFFRQFSVGDLASRAGGIEAVREVVSNSVISAILSSVFSVFSLILLFTYDVGLAVIALLLTLVDLTAIAAMGLWQLRHQRALSEKQGKIAGLVLQLITGIAKLRVAGAELRAFTLWAKEFSAQRKIAFKARNAANWLTVFNVIWPVVTTIVLFGAVAVFKNPHLTTGTFLAFLAAFTQFLVAIIGLASAFTLVLQVVPTYERSKVILEALPEVTAGKTDPGEISGAIEIAHVSFRYSPETPYILNDVSMTIQPGEFVAVVGPSGSGKSSLLRLLLGFETPDAGTIYYDNQDMSKLDIGAVRRRIGVVLQNGKLMPGDLFTNIVGSAPFSQKDAWAAARLAGFDKDIHAMPMGMFTMVSEGGSTLSGGQRQRLMIARAIIAKPRILLFDEATSALDNQTQAIVSQSLESLQATRIVIAHRLSTIQKADRIFVLQGGKFVQSGTYQELVSQPGPFQELASRQLA